MDSDVQRFLNTLFDPEEEVCVSHNKYGYSSVPLQEVLENQAVQLINTEDRMISVDVDSVLLVAINPIKGQRNDANVTAYRNFLVEMDEGDSVEQISYLKSIGTPYSCAVFSGNKSIHFAICLNESLPSAETYSFYATWILNILKISDQQTKNPSRGIRFPNNYREGVKQTLLTVKPRISLDDLKSWLSKFEECMPKPKKQEIVYTDFNYEQVPRWLRKQLIEGIDFSRGRNNTWFGIGIAMGKSGCDEDMALAILEPYFSEENDFGRNEWETALKSGVKKIRQG